MNSKVVTWTIIAVCIVTSWSVSHLYQVLFTAYEQSGTLPDVEYSWVFRLSLNMLGYSTVLLPLFILYKYVERSDYFDEINAVKSGPLWRSLWACFGERGERLPEPLMGAAGESPAHSPARESLELAFCFGGLMAAYLVWGLLQEKIMTQNYVMSDGSAVKFHDSQFLVFINRLSAFLIAGVRIAWGAWGAGAVAGESPPLYKFSYCSLTNIVSAWCQYEALKYVSFPTQVLSKSCKVIPVMLMGKVLSNNKYETYEYATAALISLGMVMFLSGAEGVTGAHASTAVSTGLSGAALLALYMSCDSFTSSWQSALFARYRTPPTHMLAAVNAFSCALTAAALARAPHTRQSIAMLAHPAFFADCALLSASSAIGQMLIYRTIARFGAVVFTIMMTLRQAMSILLSCAVYGHAVSLLGAFGVALVFVSVLLRLYCRRRVQHVRARRTQRL